MQRLSWLGSQRSGNKKSNGAEMATTHRNGKSVRAMAAARASLSTRPPGAKHGTCTLADAARDYAGDDGLCEKLVKDASELLQSEMDDLVAAVDSGEKAITTAWKEMRAAAKAGRKSQSVKPTRGHYLYVINEAEERRWAKVGIGENLKDRLDAAQHGNPRKLWVAATWWFRTKRAAKSVEKVILKEYRKAPGGNEWLEGIAIKDVNRIATIGGGQRHLQDFGIRERFQRK